MTRTSLRGAIGALTLLLGALIGGCGGSSSTGQTPSGVTSVDVTDAASSDYAHVYVTVTAVAFHTSATAGFADYSSAKTAGWQITRLAAPATVDLAQLVNGKTSADPVTGSLFNGITLPNGSYGQIRVFLASTEDALTASATADGLSYNNEVQLAGDATHYPLHIPTPVEGISLVPESPVLVTGSSNVNLVLDFNLNNDVVEINPNNGATEFILKPRLGYFDMSSVGAVTGSVTSAFGNLSSNRVVVKAEQVKAGGVGYRITRRLTTPDKSTGAFTLYPLPIFGSNTTATYDILIRGRHLATAIVKGVTVHKGSTPAVGFTSLGAVSMLASQEFTEQALLPVRPTGAWINFYQSISGDANLYEVRYRHLDPYTGKFFAANPEPLTTAPVQVASYAAGLPLTFDPDSGTPGAYTVVAEMAGLYSRGSALNITGVANTNMTMTFSNGNYSLPQVAPGATPEQISTAFNMSFFGTGIGPNMGKSSTPRSDYPSKGQVFITHGGMIVDAQGTLTNDNSIELAMHPGVAAVPMAVTYPGGVDGSVYGLYALGWGTVLAEGSVGGVDLKTGSKTVTIKMR